MEDEKVRGPAKGDGPTDAEAAASRLLAATDWLSSRPVQTVLGVLEGGGARSRVVGGAVRNTLVGRPVGDVDVATEAVPDQVVELAGRAGVKSIPTGIEHGTVTLVVEHVAIEVTTLRRDVTTHGRRAEVAFGSDWVADAGRRDFTINALYCDREGRLFDPLGGLADVAARRVRFIGEADRRIAEDYLRILRFFRFSAEYAEGEFDREGLLAAVRGRAGLRRLSGERVRTELLRILLAKRVGVALEAMRDCGTLVEALGFVPRGGLARRVAEVEVAMGLAPDALRRLAGLFLHSRGDAARIAERLRLSRVEGERLAAMASVPMPEPRQGHGELRRLLYAHGATAVVDRLVLAVAGGTLGLEDGKAATRFAETWQVPRFPVAGRDLLELGLAPGPAVGALLARIQADWVREDFAPERGELLERAAAAIAGRS
ncbi:MAG: CCA tRNA nucleotidyltransferase [Rhizobiales bacterium]|nr:CCA tRNA nucleotidyltransferase [Hyphomicrobiales bacterium]